MPRYVLILFLTALAGSVYAQIPQRAPFMATTVREFLNRCDRDTSECSFKLRMALLNHLNSPRATSVCIKDAHTQPAIIAWLKAHPEVQDMPTEDGIYVAYRTLYPCP